MYRESQKLLSVDRRHKMSVEREQIQLSLPDPVVVSKHIRPIPNEQLAQQCSVFMGTGITKCKVHTTTALAGRYPRADWAASFQARQLLLSSSDLWDHLTLEENVLRCGKRKLALYHLGVGHIFCSSFT